jgi:hypothetical protein
MAYTDDSYDDEAGQMTKSLTGMSRPGPWPEPPEPVNRNGVVISSGSSAGSIVIGVRQSSSEGNVLNHSPYVPDKQR